MSEFQKQIRNFAIISHIDHGKSTLADRFLELTNTVEKRKMREQFLDQMELERERGITIKLQPVRMEYQIQPPTKTWWGAKYILNLIDTPGHVDFSYEVSRSLAAVESAILLVDASKGVQAQTLANLHLAQEQGLVIIPVINKIDLPGARIQEVEEEIKGLFNDNLEILKISAKEGINIDEVLQAIVEKVPAPSGDLEKPLRALIFDSVYDSYKGVLAYVRIVDGQIKSGEKILLMSSGSQAEVLEVGIFRPDLTPKDSLKAGEIGYIATGLKEISLCRVGDTITHFFNQAKEPLPGYQEPKPMVFASFYPSAEADFIHLKDSLNKLKLNDASLVFEPESSEALGRGFKCGFLGMLHLEIVSERLKREYGLKLIVTTPSLAYLITEKANSLKVTTRGVHPNRATPYKVAKKEKTIYSAQEMPEPSKLETIKEPWMKLEIICPNIYLGSVMKLLQRAEGIYKTTQYLGTDRVIIKYEAPLREIIVDFYDRLKSTTSGYASMSYELVDWREADLVKMDILVAGSKVPALSRIAAKQKVYQEARTLVKKLKEVLPRQLFSLAIQAVVGGKIIARENIRALKKDVTGYLYGGDYTRKRKLLEKQKRGKKKMKAMGKVNIPPEVFLAVLKR